MKRFLNQVNKVNVVVVEHEYSFTNSFKPRRH